MASQPVAHEFHCFCGCFDLPGFNIIFVGCDFQGEEGMIGFMCRRPWKIVFAEERFFGVEMVGGIACQSVEGLRCCFTIPGLRPGIIQLIEISIWCCWSISATPTLKLEFHWIIELLSDLLFILRNGTVLPPYYTRISFISIRDQGPSRDCFSMQFV
jgi:hypothetical protein